MRVDDPGRLGWQKNMTSFMTSHFARVRKGLGETFEWWAGIQTKGMGDEINNFDM